MSVSTIGVIGAGAMGSGIAQVAATKGIDERALRIDPGVLSLTPVWARPSPRLVSDKRFP